jgi:hypothetical protein
MRRKLHWKFKAKPAESGHLCIAAQPDGWLAAKMQPVKITSPLLAPIIHEWSI